MGELWRVNFGQDEMLTALEEEGYRITKRELTRLRLSNGWMLHAPSGKRRRSISSDGTENSVREEAQTPLPDKLPEPSNKHEGSDEDASQHGAASERRKRTRKRTRAAADGSGNVLHFPSEMTIREVRAVLDLDRHSYGRTRISFKRLCREAGVTKKTQAGLERWETVKAALVSEFPQLRAADSPESQGSRLKAQAVDALCTDIAKSMRTAEKRMTLLKAKHALGVNPDMCRRIRDAFHGVLEDSGFQRRADIRPRQWDALKRRWAEQCPLIRDVLSDTRDAEDSRTRKHAVEALARDIMKRFFEKNVWKALKRRQLQSPKTDQNADSPSAEQESEREELESNGYLSMPRASPQAALGYGPPHGNTNPQLSMHLQLQPSNLAHTANTPSHARRVLTQTMTPTPLMETSLLPPSALQPVGFMRGSYAQHQYGAGATLAPPMYSQGPPMSQPVGIFMRLVKQPYRMMGVAAATMTTRTMQELRNLAMQKIPGMVCGRVMGVLKGPQGEDVPLEVTSDVELEAYMSCVTTPPTFNVQLT